MFKKHGGLSLFDYLHDRIFHYSQAADFIVCFASWMDFARFISLNFVLTIFSLMDF